MSTTGAINELTVPYIFACCCTKNTRITSYLYNMFHQIQEEVIHCNIHMKINYVKVGKE